MFAKVIAFAKTIPLKYAAIAMVLFVVVASAAIFGIQWQRLNVETEVRLKAVEKIGKLYLLKVFDDYALTNDVHGVKGIFVARCDAILSMDFENIQISHTNGTYWVEFPNIEVEQPRVDRNGLKTFAVSKGINVFNSSDPLRQAVLQEAEARIKEEAARPKNMEKALVRAKTIIETMIRAGDKDAEFEYR